MNILIFGGTRFFGKRTLAKCLLAGHIVTYVSRRKLPKKDNLEGLIGEREQLLDSLKGRLFDIVLDFSCYNEVVLHKTLCAIQTSHYVLISSVWVTQFLGNARSFSDNEKQYVILKHKAETMLEQMARTLDSATVLRFPIILGRDDHTGRLDYLASRIYRRKPITICKQSQKKLMTVCVEDATNLLVKLAYQKDSLRQFRSFDCVAEIVEYDAFLERIASNLQVNLRRIYGSFEEIQRAFPSFFEVDPFFRETETLFDRDQAFDLFSVPVTRAEDWIRDSLKCYYPGIGILRTKYRQYPWMQGDFLESEKKWNATHGW